MRIRNLLLTILFILSLSLAWNFSYAKDYEYKSLDVQADVKIDWTIDIVETFRTNFLVSKHWIIRSISLNYSVWWKDFHIDISDVYVRWAKFSTSKNNWELEIKIWDKNKTVIWEQVYPISYSTYWLIKNFSWMWYAELYWNLVWYDFDTNIDSLRAEIRLPKNNSFSSDDFLITVDWKENSVWSFAWKVDWSQWDKIIITYDKTLPAFEWITLAMKFPNDYFVFSHGKQESLIWFVWKKSDSFNIFTGWNWFFLKIMAIIIWFIVIACFIFRRLFKSIWGNLTCDNDSYIHTSVIENELNKGIPIVVGYAPSKWVNCTETGMPTSFSDIFNKNNGSYIHKSEIEDELNEETPIVVRYAPPEWVNCAEAGMLYNCILEPMDLTSLLYKWIVEWLISLRIEESVNFEKIGWFVITKLKNIDWSYPPYEVKFFNYLLPWEVNSRKAISKSSALEVRDSLKSLRNYGRSKWWITVWLFSDNTRYLWVFFGVFLFIILLLVWVGNRQLHSYPAPWVSFQFLDKKYQQISHLQKNERELL